MKASTTLQAITHILQTLRLDTKPFSLPPLSGGTMFLALTRMRRSMTADEIAELDRTITDGDCVVMALVVDDRVVAYVVTWSGSEAFFVYSGT